MDQELVDYLDRRFHELRNDLRGDIAASARELRAVIVASATELRSEIAASATELQSEIAASAAETRRNFAVMAEQLMDKIQLVGEGVIGVDRKVDRLAVEMRVEFQNVDRRFLHLQARVGRG